MFFAHDIRLNVCRLQHNKCVVKSSCDLYCVVPFNFLSCYSVRNSQEVGVSSAICFLALGTVLWESWFSHSLYQVVCRKELSLLDYFSLRDYHSKVENVVIMIFM